MSCRPLSVKKRGSHPGWEDTVLQFFNWLHDLKKKDEEKRMEVERQKVGQLYDRKCCW